ncbi:diguanylate cyclase [Thalassococcus sp. S3]|uniref:diguanylate cyclase n=1 Tax=Thalassococcus sp. S3 TaxID=2017482 RepID=UPI0010248182|nr:diguanylate cyclase [Thalassococcus sp. S3]QBF31167.1 diguanylate cyclase response regulator [Thalassococcus sp. S3]
MQGTILIVDGVATNRILLKAKLSPAFYDIAQASRAASLVDQVRATQPDLMILAAELPDDNAPAICRVIKATDDIAHVPILVLTAQDDPAMRRAALAAGADDVMSHPLNEIILQARIRSLIRARNSAEELRLRDGTSRALGFAEPAAHFAAPASVGLLSTAKNISALWQAALKPFTRARLKCFSLDDALGHIMQDSAPDVLVIALSPDSADHGLRLLADLRARANTRHSGIIALISPAHQTLAADALDLGANDVMLTDFEPEELALRIAAQIRNKQNQDRLRATVRHGLEAAVIDPMTGLYNRRYAMPHLSRVAARAAETGRSFAVMLADLDHFKRINDLYGHAAGDAVLTEAARRLTSNLRAVDLVARVGGEEFLIVMPDTGLSKAQVAAERLCEKIEESPFLTGPAHPPVDVTISVGLTVSSGREGDGALCQSGGSGASVLLGLADQALYQSKGAGRNQVTLVRPAA